MKNILILLLLVISLTSCSNAIVVEHLETGHVVRTMDVHDVTKVGDTIVMSITSTGRNFYGKYTGKLPKSNAEGKYKVFYGAYKRVK